MPEKKMWVTWLPAEEGAEKPDAVLNSLQTYGFQVSGALWMDDLERMAWYELGTALNDKSKADLWLVAGRQSDFQSKRKRYGLSLVSAMAREGRGPGFPVFCLGLDQEIESASLPLLIRDFQRLTAKDPGWASKVVAGSLRKNTDRPIDFYLSAMGHPYMGQWFEVGPLQGEWNGVMVGVSPEGQITHHLVGPRGQIPDKGIVEYPIQGIQAEVGQIQYNAWAVQNKFDPGSSYYVKVEGFPASLIIGGHPGMDQGEVTVVELC